MDVDAEKFEIVRMIITLANTLGMDAISEGIETDEQLTQLQNLGCQFGQGYLLAQPLDAQEIESMLVNKETNSVSTSVTNVLPSITRCQC